MLYAEDGITGRSLPGAEIQQGTLLKYQQCKMSALKWKCQRDHDLRVLWMEHSWHSIKIQSCPLRENVYIEGFLLCDSLCLDSALLLFLGINSSRWADWTLIQNLIKYQAANLENSRRQKEMKSLRTFLRDRNQLLVWASS